jgi:hypothetical protein
VLADMLQLQGDFPERNVLGTRNAGVDVDHVQWLVGNARERKVPLKW